MQKLCRLLAQVPSLEITGFIPYPSNLLQNPSKPHPANTATLWGTHLLNLLKHMAIKEFPRLINEIPRGSKRYLLIKKLR